MCKGNKITVAFFGFNINLNNLKSHESYDWEANDFNVIHCNEHTNIELLIAIENPDVFCSFGSAEKFNNLKNSYANVKKRWIHFNEFNAKTDGKTIMDFFVKSSLSNDDYGLISVVTPVYNIGSSIFKTYQSLLEQSYKNWEWILIDDSTDKITYDILKSIESTDSRVKLFKNKKNTGKIGEIKKYGFSLASNKYIAELDHDDVLTNDCLSLVIKTFNKYPEAGMCFTDYAELDVSSNTSLKYGETFAFGYGSYRQENYKNFIHNVTNYPNLNSYTIRHIVGVPNHIRAWRKSTYNEIGGHKKNLHIVDDYELIIRTFLHSKIAHIKKFGYIQSKMPSNSNTTDIRRKEIQRLVRFIQSYYEEKIHERILELGFKDYFKENKKDLFSLGENSVKDDQNFYIISEVK